MPLSHYFCVMEDDLTAPPLEDVDNLFKSLSLAQIPMKKDIDLQIIEPIKRSVFTQSSVEARAIPELILNAIDAIGGQSGQFGMGFKQTLSFTLT